MFEAKNQSNLAGYGSIPQNAAKREIKKHAGAD
jgi:hypothetical protein